MADTFKFGFECTPFDLKFNVLIISVNSSKSIPQV